jgi:hypothetical protein
MKDPRFLLGQVMYYNNVKLSNLLYKFLNYIMFEKKYCCNIYIFYLNINTSKFYLLINIITNFFKYYSKKTYFIFATKILK